MLKFIKSAVLLVSAMVALLVCSAAFATPTVKAASSQAASVKTAERVVKVLGHLLTRAQLKFNGELRLTKKQNFHAEAFFGTPGYIELGETYANQLSDGELTFVIAHEMAHLLGDHQARLIDAYDRKKSAGLSASANADPMQLFVLHHDLELDADRIGLVWALRAGFSASDAGSALEKAYNGSQKTYSSHPAMHARTSALLSAH